MHGVVHPDVFVKFLPTQSQAVQSEFDFFELGLGSVGEQRILHGRKTYQALVGQFQPDTAPLDPAAKRGH